MRGRPRFRPNGDSDSSCFQRASQPTKLKGRGGLTKVFVRDSRWVSITQLSSFGSKSRILDCLLVCFYNTKSRLAAKYTAMVSQRKVAVETRNPIPASINS